MTAYRLDAGNYNLSHARRIVLLRAVMAHGFNCREHKKIYLCSAQLPLSISTFWLVLSALFYYLSYEASIHRMLLIITFPFC